MLKIFKTLGGFVGVGEEQYLYLTAQRENNRYCQICERVFDENCQACVWKVDAFHWGDQMIRTLLRKKEKKKKKKKKRRRTKRGPSMGKNYKDTKKKLAREEY